MVHVPKAWAVTILATLLLLHLFVPVNGASQYTTQVPWSTAPSGRSYHTATVVPSTPFMLVFGGRAVDGTALGDSWVYDILAQSWEKVSWSTGPYARYQHAAAAYGSQVIISGGRNATKYYTDAWRCSLMSGNSCTRLSGLEIPQSIFGHSLLLTKTGVVQVFGQQQDGTKLRSPRILPKYTTEAAVSSMTFSNLIETSLVPDRRAFSACAVFDSPMTILCFGGVDGTGQVLGDAWEFKPVSGGLQNEWEWSVLTAASKAPTPRYAAVSTAADNTLVLQGGVGSDTIYSDAYTLAYGENSIWTHLPTTLEELAGHSAALFADNSTFIFFGGSTASGEMNTQVVQIGVGDSDFITLDAAKLGPPSRSLGVMVCTTNLRALHGGLGSDGNTYSDTWISFRSSWAWQNNTANTSPSLLGHQAVTVDSTAFVFGGQRSNGALSDSMYTWHIASGTWNLMQPASPPPPVFMHSMAALPNGQGLIVCGGRTSSSDATALLSRTYAIETDFQPDAASAAGKALHFDGINDVAHAPAAAQGLNGSFFTVEAWVRVARFDAVYQGFVASGLAGTGFKVYRCADLRILCFTTYGTTNLQLRSQTAVNDGKWHHVSATYNGTHKVLYIDGQLDAIVATTGFVSGLSDLTVGSAVDIGNPTFWSGDIDDVKLWNAALSHNEVVMGMYSTTSTITSDSRLWHWWTFDSIVSATNSVSDFGSRPVAMVLGSGISLFSPGNPISGRPTDPSHSRNPVTAGSWYVVSTGQNPTPRHSAAMATASGSAVVLYGGIDANGGILSDTWILEFSPGSRNGVWSLLQAVIDQSFPAKLASLFPIGPGQVLAIGVNETSGNLLQSTITVTPASIVSASLPGTAFPALRGMCSASCPDHSIALFGGAVSAGAHMRVLATGNSVDGLTPRPVPGDGPPGNFWPVLVQKPNGNWLSVQGWTAAGPVEDIYEYNPKLRSWKLQAFSGSGPGVRSEAPVVAIGSDGPANLSKHAVTFGGENLNSFFNDVHLLNLETLEWSTPNISGPIPPNTAYHMSFVRNSKLYSFGGLSSYWNDHDQLWTLNLNNMTWKQESTSGASKPSQRFGHAFVRWSDNYAVVFGGQQGQNTRLSDIWLLNLDTMAWTATNVPNGPPNRRSPGALVFGNRLLIFGGLSAQGVAFGGELNDLWVLELSTTVSQMSWKQLPISGSPAGRASPALVAISKSSFLLFGGITHVPEYTYLSDATSIDLDIAFGPKCLLSGPNLKSAVAGQRGIFSIQPKNALGESLINCKDDVSVEFMSKTSQVRFQGIVSARTPCMYDVQFTPLTADIHVVTVRVNGQIVGAAQSPFEADILPNSPAAAQSSLQFSGSSPCDGIVAGDQLAVTMVTRDKFNNQAMSGANAHVVMVRKLANGTSTEDEIAPYLEDSLDGTYVISATVTRAANYSLEVEFFGQEISGSPFWCNVSSASYEPSNTLLYNPPDSGTLTVDPGQAATLLLGLRDRFGNNVTVDDDETPISAFAADSSSQGAISGDSLIVRVLRRDDGLYSVVFFPFAQGQWNLNLSISGHQILYQGAPFMLQVDTVFEGYKNVDVSLRMAVSAPIAAIAAGLFVAFILHCFSDVAGAENDSDRTAMANVAQEVQALSRSALQGLPPHEVLALLCRLRYLNGRQQADMIKLLEKGDVRVWAPFDRFFKSKKPNKFNLARLGGEMQSVAFSIEEARRAEADSQTERSIANSEHELQG